jgi:DGQHR domain-containing protein
VAKSKTTGQRTRVSLTATNYRYGSFRFSQTIKKKSSALVVFYAPVGEVLSWAEVGVLTSTTSGHQRERRDAKVKAIGRFLLANERNMIPTAVIVAFTRGAVAFRPLGGALDGLGELQIKGTRSSANIVDGQHRLYGMEQHDAGAKVAIVGLLDADDVEKAFHFLVINNKSTKVPTTHVKAVLASMQETALIDRLRGAGIAFDADGIRDVDVINTDKDSPFYHSVAWSTTPQASRLVQATALEASLAYLGNLSVPELEDRDVRRSFFLAMWKAIKETWGTLWTENSRLISKVGVVCLTRFLSDRITTWADNDRIEINILDLEQIATQTREIIAVMDTRFWTHAWAERASGGFDTNQGRDRVVAALTRLYRNGKRNLPWNEDIDIIEPSDPER